MTDPFFFQPSGPITVGEVIDVTGAEPTDAVDRARVIANVAPLDLAGPDDLSFCDGPRYFDALRATAARVCLIPKRHAGHAPAGVTVLVTDEPYQAYVAIARRLHAGALRPAAVFDGRGISPGANVHPDARLEDGVVVDPGAVIGPRAEIGAGTLIGANAVIGADVKIGRDCSIGPGSTILYALIGDRVILHPGVRIGQDGFGYVQTPQRAHVKVPQIGRVIIQDDVEIGAGSAIDRGAGRDTMIGEGTKIDNLVQIGHNATIGRHCILVGLCGVAGSAVLADYVMIGGQAGIADHTKVGEGARIAGGSGVQRDVPPGDEWGGTPAMPMRDWVRLFGVVRKVAALRPDDVVAAAAAARRREGEAGKK
jgi:UDP-3-O-[3-hydroxymyristoyl] glucosamine N-acyltransferase